jgi:hypothetical protein
MKAISLKRASLVGLIAGALTLSVLAASPAAAAEKALKAPKAASLEEQLQFLRTSLTESFRTRDWKMMEMVVEGLKAAGVKGADAEIFVLRAERDAALQGRIASSVILSWGLACRVRLGDKRALAALRRMALQKPTAVANPAGKKLPREEASKAWAAYRQYTARLREMDSALLALAMLGEKDASATALKRIRSAGGKTGDIRALTAAALAGEENANWKALVETCSFKDGSTASFSTRARLLSTLASMISKDQPGKRSAAFRIDGALTRSAPADAGEQLRKAFIALAARATEDRRGPWTLLRTAGTIPGFKEDAAAVAALKGLGSKMTGHVAKSWNAQIKRLLGESADKSKTKPADNKSVEKF